MLSHCNPNDFSSLVEFVGMEKMFVKTAKICRHLIGGGVITLPKNSYQQIADKAILLSELLCSGNKEKAYGISLEIAEILHRAALGIGGFSALNIMAMCIDQKMSPQELTDFLLKETCEQARAETMSAEIFDILNEKGMPKELQEQIIEKRPDLIGQIRNLDPELKAKHSRLLGE